MTEKTITPEVTHPEKKWVCAECIKEEYLSNLINNLEEEGKCSYCDKSSRTIALEDLAEYVKQFFDDHFILDTEDPDHPRLSFMREMDGNVEEIIEEHARVEIEIAQDLRIELSNMHLALEDQFSNTNNPFDELAFYNERKLDSDYWDYLWSELKKIITEKNRMFNTRAKEILDSVFGNNVVRYNDIDKHLSTIVEIGPNSKISSLFRAREFQSTEKLHAALKHPDRKLGPPPSSLATAGRMNAEGISVFYGAISSKVAIAEIRPVVGSRVVVAKFDIIRDLRLLDVGKLKSLFVPGSLFDPSQRGIMEKIRFVSGLCERISAPVMPQDESADYLVTQAVSDYLSELTLPTAIDGLIYHSAQVGNEMKNVVLFHKSSQVEYRNEPDSVFVYSDTEDSEYPYDSDIETEYRVYEKIVNETQKNKEGVNDIDDDVCVYYERKASLKLDPSNISVHHIRRVDFETRLELVERYNDDPLEVSEF